MPTPPPAHGRLVRFFFMHLGTLVSIIVYFATFESRGHTVQGLSAALLTALAVHTGYLLLARWRREDKQFDIGLWIYLGIGALAVAGGIEPIVNLYLVYSPALLFTMFGLTAIIPMALGWEPFTVYFGVRQAPRWQHSTPAFADISRMMAVFWSILFFVAAWSCASHPYDPLYTTLIPNGLVLLVGLPAGTWLPPLWMKFFPSAVPTTAEPLIMGMPFLFDRRAAADAQAVIQFRVSGSVPGDYWVRVGGGRCESFEGMASKADLTVHTPDEVWVAIARGDVDGGQALMENRYTVEGDPLILTKLREWFPGNRS